MPTGKRYNPLDERPHPAHRPVCNRRPHGRHRVVLRDGDRARGLRVATPGPLDHRDQRRRARFCCATGGNGRALDSPNVRSSNHRHVGLAIK